MNPPLVLRKARTTRVGVPVLLLCALMSVSPCKGGSAVFEKTANLITPGAGSATLLPDGELLVVSGLSAELYDAASATWSSTGTPIMSRGGQSATLLPDGKVLVAGGDSL